MSDLVVRKATRGDLRDILTFLEREYDRQSAKGGFWCNRNLIEQGQADNELEVLVQPRDGKVLAFCLWSLHPVSMDIIEVRPGYRRKGFGRYLTQYVLNQLQEKDPIGVEVICMPAKSLPVWRRVGFQKIKREGCTGTHAVYLFRRTREFPEDAEIKTITIRLVNRGKRSGRPFCCQGMIKGAKCILQTDFAAYLSVMSGHMLKIYVDGHLKYSDEVRYSTDAGVEVDGNFVRCRELDMSKLQSNID